MAKALKHLLVTLKGCIDPQEKDYRYWESLFPRALRVKAKPSKATHLSQKAPLELLGIFADEWRSSEDLVDFVAAADAVRTASDDEGRRAALAPLRASVGDGEAYQQFGLAVRRALTQTTVSFADGSLANLVIGSAIKGHSGARFGLLFEDDFVERLGEQIAGSGEYPAQDGYDLAGFVEDYHRICGAKVQGGEVERQQVVALLALCVMACLVGPGRHAGALGYQLATPRVDTLTPLDLDSPDEGHDVQRFRLQPIVMNGFDVFAYRTDNDLPGVEFCRGDEVRIGRPADGSAGWLEQGVAVRLSCPSVSRMHAKLSYLEGRGWVIEDLGSSYGTLLIRAHSARNEFLRGGAAPLRSGDLVFLAPKAEVLDRGVGSSLVYPLVGVRGFALRFERC